MWIFYGQHIRQRDLRSRTLHLLEQGHFRVHGTFPQRKTSLLSTERMLRHVANSPAREFAVGTELGILHSMRHQFPDKDFYPVNPSAVCAFMKTITLDGILRALEIMSPQVCVPEPVAQKAKRAIDRMLELA